MPRVHQVKVHVPPRLPLDGQSPLRFCAPDASCYLGDDELREARANGGVIEALRAIDERDIPVRFFLPHDGAVNDPPPAGARVAVLARLLSEGRANGEVHIRFLGRNRSVPPDGFVLDRAGGERKYVWQIVPSEEVEGRPDLVQRFRALRGHLAHPDRRVVLALGSGGLKLFSHATVLRLLDAIAAADHVDEVWGSSAGALVALLYCHGLSPHAIEQTGYDLYSGRLDLALRPSRLQLLRHLVRDAIRPSTDTAEAGFVDCAEGLSRMLSQYCDTSRPARRFYCVAFNLAECRSEVLAPGPVPAHLADLVRPTDAREAALASCAVPLLFVPRSIARNGHRVPYVDGSTTEDVPLHSVVRKWDLDRAAGAEPRSRLTILYVRLTGPLARFRAEGGRMSKLRLLQTVASGAIDTMHQRDVAALSTRPDVELLGLRLADSGADFFDVRRIPEFIRLAKESFPEQLAAIEDRLRDE